MKNYDSTKIKVILCHFPCTKYFFLNFILITDMYMLVYSKVSFPNLISKGKHKNQNSQSLTKATLNFVWDCVPGVCQPYIDYIRSKIYQTQCLNKFYKFSISCLKTVIKEIFQNKYYHSIHP